MLADAGARLVVTEEAQRGLLGGAEAKTVCVDSDAALIEVQDGANLNIADRQGVTPLGHAKSRGYAAMVRILEAAGAR